MGNTNINEQKRDAYLVLTPLDGNKSQAAFALRSALRDYVNEHGLAVTKALLTALGTAQIVLAAPTYAGTPTITGTAQVGATLTGVPGTNTAGVPVSTILHEWLANDVVIPNANASTLVVPVSALGQTIKYRYSRQNGSGSVTKTSVATAAVIAA